MKQLPTLEEMLAVRDKFPVDPADVRAALTRVPADWSVVEETEDGAYYRRGPLLVGYTVGKYQDGELWLHVSVSGNPGRARFRLPDWEELKRVKHDFIGPDKWAYQVFPDERVYVNDHPCVLHLFARYHGEPALPDFTRGLKTL